MNEWQDVSDRNGERYVWDGGVLRLDLARFTGGHAGEPWSCIVRYAAGLTVEHRGCCFDALLCVDDAKARALAYAKPIADAIAERSAAVVRTISVAVAGARLESVG